MRSTAQQIVEKLLDDIPLDEWMADWIKDKWNDVKAVTGIGSDEFGLGKNTEKGWKPKYGQSSPRQRVPRPRTRQDPKTKVWNVG